MIIWQWAPVVMTSSLPNVSRSDSTSCAGCPVAFLCEVMAEDITILIKAGHLLLLSQRPSIDLPPRCPPLLGFSLSLLSSR